MHFTTAPGGVMTREAGAITGDVEATLAPDRQVRIRYAGTDERYTVADGPAPEGIGIDIIVLRLARDLGVDAQGNAIPTSLATQPDADDGYIDDEPDRLGDQLF